jgi:PAS domain S-box-containing protein
VELSEFKGILRQVLLLPIVALLLLAGILIWQFRESNSTVVLIEQSDRRISIANRLSRLSVDEESGLRGYQTTGDASFLQPYRDAEAPIQQGVEELRSITAGSGPNLKRFLREHDTWHQTFAEPLIATIAAGGSTNDIALNLQGKQRMDAVRASLDAMISLAEQRRAERLALWHRQIHDMILGLIGLAFAIGVGIGIFTRSRLHRISDAFRRALEQQHHRAEELFRSEQNLRTTLASIGDGVIACDAAGTIQTMNPVAQEMTGWLQSEAISRPLEEVFHIVDDTTRQRVESPMEKVKRLNRIVGQGNHAVLIRKDGTELTIDDSGAPMRNGEGELTGVVLVFRDITMERRTRAALLANEKLAVAGRLAATIAHEIHNPLDSVANLLFLLESGSTPEESTQFLHMAQSELARVTQISRAMLSLYRESKAPVPVNLKDMLDGLLLLMERRFHDLGVTARAEMPSEIAVDGFPAELRQVFTNLITNAAEAAGKGGTVTVRVLPRAASPGTAAGATIEIIDNGPGIHPAVRNRLFEPFFTTKGERGTGLGLWVSQGIIRKHGGTLELQSGISGPHRGTTASVFLASKPMIDPGGD